MANEQPEILRAERLRKVYDAGQVVALADASLSIARGEYVAVIGPSGSGKSTLLNLLGLLDEPTSGQVFFEGQAVASAAQSDRIRALRIGFVFQSFHLLPMLTAWENVQIPMFETTLSPSDRRSKAAALLHRVGMAHRVDHLPLRLSVGERQRVAIARALANDPVLLLADEPTGNLDTQTGRDILALFAQLREQANTTLVLITHDPEVARTADRVISIRDGQIESDVPSRGSSNQVS